MTNHAINRVLRPAVLLGVGLGALEFTDLKPFVPTGWLTWALPVLALVYLVFAAARGGSGIRGVAGARRGVLRRQVIGVLLFTAFAVVALVLDPRVGQFIVAMGWFGHATWDYAHRDGTVVPRWYVDFCLPFDLLVGASLVFAAVR